MADNIKSSSTNNILVITLTKLIPFFLTVIVYFATCAFRARHNNTVWSTIVKCLPIYSLIIFVLLDGKLNRNYYYNLRLIFGLIFCSVGDVLLNIDHFEFGVVAFFIGHLFYLTCFGFRPWKIWIGIPLYLFCLIVNIVFLVLNKNIMQVVLVFIYSNLLVTMAWRSIARVDQGMKFTPKMIGAVGSICFLVSDSVLAVNMFVVKSDILTIFVMSTYYSAQLCIALTAIEA